MVAPRSPPPPAYDEHTAYSPVAGTSAAAAAGGGDRSYGRGNPGSSQSYSQAPQLQQAPPPEARFHSTTAAPGAGPPPPSFSHQHSGHSQFDDAHSQASASSMSAPYAWNHASHGSASSGAGGISGYLKAFTKKAVRVAKAGLAQLEHALEGLDQGAAGGGGGAGEQYGGGAYSATSDRGAEGGQISNDEALAWAVRLADMAPHAQQQELAQMPPPLRRRVIEVLREQIRSEHEAVRSGSATSSHEAHDTYVPPGAGHGHGAPMAPPMPYRGSSDGAYQAPHIGAPAAAAPAPPPAVAAPAQAQAPPPPAPVAPPPPPAPAHHESHDLLGMGSGGLSPMGSAATPAAAAARATYPAVPAASAPPPTQPPVHVPVPAPAPAVEDLLGFDDGPSSSAAPRPAASTSAPTAAAAQPPPPPPPQQPAQAPVAAAAAVAAAASAAAAAAVHVDDMDDFFSGGRPAASSRGAATPPPPAAAAAAAAAAARAGSVHASASAPHLVAGRSAGVSGSNSAAALFDMLHDEEAVGVDVGSVDVSEYADLYKGEQGHADEPEIRKRLRAQREKAKHDQMKAALKAKLEMEAEEAARREQQVELKEQYKANIETWKNRNKGNIRGLLGSLQTVLWPDSGWTPVSVGDMLEPLQVKKVWMRANLLVHPDKVRQRNGTAEQVAIADMVFDVLKDTYNSFR
ncbi:hypothetical protein HXX76_000583 [Chlamydomonas incerta]|uniref:J domain-containing protein n=1 Tax=Chlamydomonas incerta TaxID=51695 RepID=A0A835WF58_CHLIN|nr:hypothetical protein HXX76_000583 [Chlamydomonas incerta]|eukprot:KAG2445980.1 hypothetical protein HXX76_000583 [Chlamydomonas incerta]